MITTLITPSQVLELAFDSCDEGVKKYITNSQILACEARYIQPVFGEIYNAMLRGEHEEFVQNYIKPALALYVKAQILPFLGVMHGSLGLAFAATHQDLDLDEDRVQQLRDFTLSDANALVLRAVRYVKESPEDFEYCRDLTKICSSLFVGGIII